LEKAHAALTHVTRRRPPDECTTGPAIPGMIPTQQR
jgi:hypothetical protein